MRLSIIRKPLILLTIIVLTLVFYKHTTFPSPTFAQSTESPEDTWPMAAGNPQRTSYTLEEVRGQLYPQWYKPIEPFISTKIQPIIANDTIFVATAKGLYAFSTVDGSQRWVYPTEMPLGHSPTYINGTLYVPGLDHKIHAVNATNGQLLWTYEGEAGFQTNPLVINNIVYAGNRDGYMYAIYSNDHVQKGTLAWRFKTNGPIQFSAAYQDATDNKIYFASNDSYAYAVNAINGTQVWKTKLPGGGFQSWWPVVTGNKVIFTAVDHYRPTAPPPVDGIEAGLYGLDRTAVYPNRFTDPRGTPVCGQSAVQSDGSINASCISQYFQNNSQRRTYFVLDSATGNEITPYAPILWAHAPSGNRYPPAVDPDTGILYQKKVICLLITSLEEIFQVGVLILNLLQLLLNTGLLLMNHKLIQLGEMSFIGFILARWEVLI